MIIIGEDYVEVSGARTWLADKHFNGGTTFSDFSKNIQSTIDDPIYETERNGEFTYEIPVPEGSYEITLHFAES
jgi:large repetitive protein